MPTNHPSSNADQPGAHSPVTGPLPASLPARSLSVVPLAWTVALCAGLAVSNSGALAAQAPAPAPSSAAGQPPTKDKDKPKPAPTARPVTPKPPTPTPIAPVTPPATTPPKSTPVPAASPPQPVQTPAGTGVGGRGVTTLIPGSPEPAADGTVLPPPSAPEPLPGLVLEGNAYRFSRFAEPVELNLIVELIIQESKIEVVTTDAALTAMKKKVDFGSPLTIPKEKLLSFLSTIVESQGAALSRDPIGYYTITMASEAKGLLGTDEFSTTRIIPTRGLRPTALSSLINTALLGGTPIQGAPAIPGANQGGGGGGRISFLDDLGLILMNDTPRRIDTVESLVEKLIEEQGKQAISHFDILHISAAVAKQRLLELLGSRSGRPGANTVEAQQQAALAAATGNPSAGGSLSNIADRLTPDPQSNSLVFRGRDDEKEFISKLLLEIDRPSQLKGKWYPLGSASAQLAQMGRRQQLGEIVSFEGTTGNQQGGRGNLANASPSFVAGQIGQQLSQQGQESGGPMFVLDPEGRGFMYFGTPEQQLAVEEIARQFSELLKNEEIVLEFYKLRH
ncbi:MAG: hypothetical protein ACT4PL_01775, partial [Phycisphaerales bacterium]